MPKFENSEWPSIRHSQYDEVVQAINQNMRLVISGRRRIGKSFMISQIAHSLWREESVFYIGLPKESVKIENEFVEEFYERLEQFDKNITKPKGPGKTIQTKQIYVN